MMLDEFYDYKNQLIGDLLTNENIVRLLADDCKPVNDTRDLIYTQVFPFEYVPETIEHGMTFICCDVDIQKSVNKTFLPSSISGCFLTRVSLDFRMEKAACGQIGYVLKLHRRLTGADTMALANLICMR